MHRSFPVFAFRTVFPHTFLSPSSSTQVILLLYLFSFRFGSALFVVHWIAREAAFFSPVRTPYPFFVLHDLPLYIEGESNVFFLNVTQFYQSTQCFVSGDSTV